MDPNGHFIYAINIFISEVKTPRFPSLAPGEMFPIAICTDLIHQTRDI